MLKKINFVTEQTSIVHSEKTSQKKAICIIIYILTLTKLKCFMSYTIKLHC